MNQKRFNLNLVFSFFLLLASPLRAQVSNEIIRTVEGTFMLNYGPDVRLEMVFKMEVFGDLTGVLEYKIKDSNEIVRTRDREGRAGDLFGGPTILAIKSSRGTDWLYANQNDYAQVRLNPEFTPNISINGMENEIENFRDHNPDWKSGRVLQVPSEDLYGKWARVLPFDSTELKMDDDSELAPGEIVRVISLVPGSFLDLSRPRKKDVRLHISSIDVEVEEFEGWRAGDLVRTSRGIRYISAVFSNGDILVKPDDYVEKEMHWIETNGSYSTVSFFEKAAHILNP